MAYLSLSGPNIGPSWLQVGSRWAHVGSNLAQVGAMLASDPDPLPPLSQPKPFQIPSQALQEPIQEATPRPPGLGSWIWSLGSTFWTSQTPNLDLKTARHGSKKDLPRLQILSAQARWLGRSLFIYKDGGGAKFSKNPRYINLTRAINLGNQTVCCQGRWKGLG